MRYVVGLESPDMKRVQDALRAQIIELSRQHAESKKSRGMVSDLTIELGQTIKALERGLAALVDAASKAVPERAIPRSEPPHQSLQDFVLEPVASPTQRAPVARPVSAREVRYRRYRGSWQSPPR